MAKATTTESVMKSATEVNTIKIIDKNPLITVDNSISDVIELDKNKVHINFESTPGKFKELPLEVVKELSFENKQRYMISKQLFELESGSKPSTRGAEEDTWKYDVEYLSSGGTATEKIEVKNKKADRVYRWVRTSNLGRRLNEGWRVCKDVDVVTGSTERPGKHEQTLLGRATSVLVEIPRENYQKVVSRKKAHTDLIKGSFDEKSRDNLSSSTGMPAELID